MTGYKEELKAANDALQQARQQETQQQEAQKDAEEEFVIRKRSIRGAGTPLNRVRPMFPCLAGLKHEAHLSLLSAAIPRNNSLQMS